MRGRLPRAPLVFSPAIVAAAGLATMLASPRAARADGAFPDAQTILVPASRPEEIILVTNFGLIMTADGGATWAWSCERDANAFGAFYQQSAPPRRRLFTVAGNALVFSDDLTCGWSTAGGLLGDDQVLDAFVDRRVSDRVLAITSRCCEANQRTFAAFESMDGGATFARMLYRAEPGTVITGVESAASDPRVVYLTLARGAGATRTPLLARSIDGGATFALTDLTGQIGPSEVRLIAVDPDDVRHVLLLRTDAAGQALVITRDGGATAAVVLVPTGTMKSVLLTAAGTILVAVDDDGLPALFRSQDHGETFQAVFNPPHVRALAERGGTIYAATDNIKDRQAIAGSTDDGTTWQAIMSYEETRGILACVSAACQVTCQAEATLGVWPKEMCAAPGVVLATDTDGAAGAADLDAGDRKTDADPDATPTGGADGGGAAGSGCGCALAAAPPRAVTSLALGIFAGVIRRRRRR